MVVRVTTIAAARATHASATSNPRAVLCGRRQRCDGTYEVETADRGVVQLTGWLGAAIRVCFLTG
jgi:hypothetical protein